MALIQRRLPNGQPVSIVDPGEAALIYREIFVEESYLRPGFPAGEPQVIFDIGANIGLASMFFKQRFPGAFIVAAEPGPEPYLALRRNFRLHVPDGTPRNLALSDRRGVARFGYYPGAPAESGFYADPSSETELATRLLVQTGLTEPAAARLSRNRHQISFLECHTVTLSDLLRDTGVDQIDLLKIDVEKSEHRVLAGVDDADWPRIRQLVLEVHDVRGRLARILTRLTELGFQVQPGQEDRLAGTDMHMVFATRARASDVRADLGRHRPTDRSQEPR